ncbi:hypothetical protein [Wenyingzhuangia sp. IMCC45574]
MKIKKVLSILSLFLVVTTTFSQKYIEKIAEESCGCVEKLPKDLSKEEATIKFGFCLLNASQPYAKKLKKDLGISIEDNGTKDGRKLGRVLGLKMVPYCPDVMMKVGQLYLEAKKDAKSADKLKPKTEVLKAANGIIRKVEKSNMIAFVLESKNQKREKLYWFSYIITSYPIVSDYMDLVAKKVAVKYEIQEYFDVKINEYRKIKVIKELVVKD